jgi:hypothetical protein
MKRRRWSLKETLCIDCGMQTQPHEANHNYEQYIVRDEVWQAAGMPLGTIDPKTFDLIGGGGCLCVGCIETRLERQLTIGDFAAYTIGLALIRRAAGWYTPRLAARIIDPIERALFTRPLQTNLEPDGLSVRFREHTDTDTALTFVLAEEGDRVGGVDWAAALQAAGHSGEES